MKEHSCGATPIIETNAKGTHSRIKCESCGLKTSFYKTGRELIAAWRKRALK